jgi:hypothetical protein
MFYLCGTKYFHNSFPDKHNSIIVGLTKIIVIIIIIIIIIIMEVSKNV